MSELEQKIFDIQCDSTKALLRAQRARPLEDDALYISNIKFTPIAKEAQCVKEDGSVDLNVRTLTQTEADFHNSVRRVRGSVIESLKRESVAPTLTESRKEKAITAFLSDSTLDSIKKKFKDLMNGLFKPSYAEIVAEEIRKSRQE